MNNKKKTVFTPNATSKLIVDQAANVIKKKSDILDLGCGDGYIGLNIYKKIKNKVKNFYFSDLSKKATKRCEANAKKYKLRVIVKNGSMFKPWKNHKFDFIVESVSAISEPVANRSPWYNKNIPCKAGVDGCKLVNKIILDSKKHLNKNGKLIFPIVSFSKKEKIVNFAKKNYKKVTLLSSKDWPLPKSMYKHEKIFEKLKKKNLISYKKKFGIILYTSYIYLAIK